MPSILSNIKGSLPRSKSKKKKKASAESVFPDSQPSPSLTSNSASVPNSPALSSNSYSPRLNSNTHRQASNASALSSLSRASQASQSTIDFQQITPHKAKGIAALPIAKKVVNEFARRTRIAIHELNLYDCDHNRANITLAIKLQISLPVKANISFPVPIDLLQEGSDGEAGAKIASVTLAPLKIGASAKGTVLRVPGKITLDDASCKQNLAGMVTNLLNSSGSVTYIISTHQAEVKAYGLKFGQVSLVKQIAFQGLDRLDKSIQLSDRAHSQEGYKEVSVQDFQVIGGSQDKGIEYQAKILLSNSSNTAAYLGKANLLLAVPMPSSLSNAHGRPVDVPIGPLEVENLDICRGKIVLQARGRIKIPSTRSVQAQAGYSLITQILENRSIPLAAIPSPNMSEISWIRQALAPIRLPTSLAPFGLDSRLLDGATLIPAEPNSKDPLMVRATLRNNFDTTLQVRSLQVQVLKQTDDPNAEPLHLGTIQTTPGWTGLLLPAKEPTHASLPFQLPEHGSTYVDILEYEAHVNGIQISSIVKEALQYMPRPQKATSSSVPSSLSSEKRSRSSSNVHEQAPHSVDLPELVARVLSSLQVSAHVQAQVSIGDFRVPGPISFVQENLPVAITVKTARMMLPIVGAPLVDALIKQAEVHLSCLEVLDMDEGGLTASADIRLVNFGPLAIEVFADDGFEVRVRSKDVEIDPNVPLAKITLQEALRGIPDQTDVFSHTMVRFVPIGGSKGIANFAALITALMQRDEVQVEINSTSCRILAGNAEFPTKLVKNLKIPGLGGLPDISLKDFKILGETQAPIGPGRGRALSTASSASATSGQSTKEMAYQIQTHVQIKHSGKLALALSSFEAGIEYRGFQIGIISVNDVNFRPAPDNTVNLLANGHIFIGRESLPRDMSLESYRAKALEAIGDLMSALLAGTTLEFAVRGYRAFAVAPGTQTYAVRNGISRGSLTASQASPSLPSTRRMGSGSLGRSASISTTASSRSVHKQVPWLDQAFQGFNTTASMYPDRIDPVKSIKVGQLDVEFSRQKKISLSIRDIGIQLHVPYSITFDILAVRADIELLFEGHGVVGRASINETDAKMLTSAAETQAGAAAEEGGVSKHITLQPKGFELCTEDDQILGDMILHVADCENTDKISVRGTGHAKLSTVLGEVAISVDLGERNHSLDIEGMRSLRSSPVQYTNLQVVDASPEFLKIVFSLYLNNPSEFLQIRIDDSELSMGAYYRGAYVGRAYIGKGLFIPSGPVAVHDIHFRYSPSDEKHVREIPANFLSGKSTMLEIRGDDQSIDQPCLLPTLKNIQLAFELKPIMQQTLIDSISITLGMGMLTSSMVDCVFVVNNPLGVPFDLCALSFMATYRSDPFGSCTIRYAHGSPLRVAPGTPKEPGKQASSPVPVTLAQPLEKLVGTFLQTKGTILLDVELSARVEIQGFKIPVFDYHQPQLPLHIKGLGGISGLLKLFPGQ